LTTPQRAFVGLGANTGGEAACIARLVAAARAVAALPEAVEVVGSSLWATAPVGPLVRQADFLNAIVAVRLRPPSTPGGLLAALLAIETALGRARDREFAQGARPIDLDLLLVDDLRMEEEGPPRLVLPHPRMWDRRFVLAPLAELVGESFVVPMQSLALGDRLAAPSVAGQRVRRLAPWPWGGAS
jgi:2-amino-4-hydroxy-6-hydroxymethyldihydropteridine diphosphokinase